MGKVVNPVVSEAVRKEMTLHGITASDLAVKLGQSRQSIYNRISSGKFTFYTAKQWADAIGCSESVFLYGEDTSDRLFEMQKQIDSLREENSDLKHRIDILERTVYRSK